jgi:S1-C subfamily serine protease
VEQGVVRALNAPVEARCQTCSLQTAFTFEDNAGPGFSGGPVVDAASGRLVGVTFGYLDPNGHRLIRIPDEPRAQRVSFLHRPSAQNCELAQSDRIWTSGLGSEIPCHQGI